MDVTRRRVLVGTLIGSPLLSGCLDGAVRPPTASRGAADGDELVEYETASYTVNAGETRAKAVHSRAAAVDVIGDAMAEADLEEFVDATDFDRAVIVFVQARGPNLCYDLELETVEVDTAGLRVEVSVVDTAEPGELCAEQIHYPTLLVRAVFEDAARERGTVTVTDADGEVWEFPYDPDANSDAPDDG